MILKISKTGRNEDLLLEEVGEVNWQDFYGVRPNTQPWLSRNNFNLIHTVPVPNQAMWVDPWYKQTIVLDVVEKDKEGEKNTSHQKEVIVVYDEHYIGYYLSIILRNLACIPEDINLEVAEEFADNIDPIAIDKKLADKLIKQRWERLRQLVLGQSVAIVLAESQEVDMNDVEALISAIGATGQKADALRQKALTDPRAFTQYKEMILESLSKLI